MSAGDLRWACWIFFSRSTFVDSAFCWSGLCWMAALSVGEDRSYEFLCKRSKDNLGTGKQLPGPLADG